MSIKESKKTVYTCSDGKEFTSRQDAKDHEFDTTCPPSSGPIRTKELRQWLIRNKNFVLDYIGTQRDPEPEYADSGQAGAGGEQ